MPISSAYEAYERAVHKIVDCDFLLDPPGLELLLDDHGDRLFGYLSVDRKRVAVLVVARRRIGRIHLHVFADRP
ncbi:MAG: hypothetical protein HYS67_04570, partial [Deltaproteobacteria bacterium]|nr:hypothetical protein [Deltaproteobacteria bacterium]